MNFQWCLLKLEPMQSQGWRGVSFEGLEMGWRDAQPNGEAKGCMEGELWLCLRG